MADYSNNPSSYGTAETAESPFAAKRSRVIRYARDNAFVRGVHSLTTGPFAWVFVIALIVAVALSIYFPLQDLYVAYRSQSILEEQLAIRTAYNEQLESEVASLLTEEGVQDAARKTLGMVMEGETAVTVTGLDEDGNAIVEEVETDDAEETATDADGEDADAESDEAEATMDDSETDDATDTASDSPSTAAEVKAAEAAVYENSAWYWKVLDAIFCFDGTTGQAVVSTGE